jgi:hypothetical protein
MSVFASARARPASPVLCRILCRYFAIGSMPGTFALEPSHGKGDSGPSHSLVFTLQISLRVCCVSWEMREVHVFHRATGDQPNTWHQPLRGGRREVRLGATVHARDFLGARQPNAAHDRCWLLIAPSRATHMERSSEPTSQNSSSNGHARPPDGASEAACRQSVRVEMSILFRAKIPTDPISATLSIRAPAFFPPPTLLFPPPTPATRACPVARCSNS